VSKTIPSALIGALLFAAGAQAATFTVTNTNDSGAGSLRQAITDGVAATVGANHDTVINYLKAVTEAITPTSMSAIDRLIEA